MFVDLRIGCEIIPRQHRSKEAIFVAYVAEAAAIFDFELDGKENKKTTKLNQSKLNNVRLLCFSSFSEPILTLSANSCTPLCSVDIIKCQNKITFK